MTKNNSLFTRLFCSTPIKIALLVCVLTIMVVPNITLIGVVRAAVDTKTGRDPTICDSTDKDDPNNPCSNKAPTYTLLEPLPCLNDGGTQTCNTATKTVTDINFANYVQYIFNLIIAISAVAAVLVIVAGGFRYVTSDAFQGKNEGKKMITEALKGLLLVLCSYLILRTIDPRLVAIPSTIVPPLNIDASKRDSAADFFKNLSRYASSAVEQDLAKLRATDKTLLLANKSITNEIKKLQTERGNFISQIKEASGAKSDEEALQQCNNSFADTRVNILCTLIAGNKNKEDELSGTRLANIARVVMNVHIADGDALGGSQNLKKEDLHVRIDADLKKYEKIISESGQVQFIPQLRDYAEYSKSMVNIYSTIAENTQWNPYVVGVLDTFQQFTRDSAAVVGTLAGGGINPVSGAIGFAGGAIVGSAVTDSIKNSVNAESASRTISSIQTEVNAMVKSQKIKDEKSLAAYKEQAYALIKVLGGKGDGTDPETYVPYKNVDITPTNAPPN